MDQHLTTSKCPSSGVFGTKSSFRPSCTALSPGINRRPNTVPARNGTYAPSPRRPATKSWGVWKEIASGAKQESAERKKVLALAQARKVDVILVTELTSWGRSVLNVL